MTLPKVSCMLPTQGRSEFSEFACWNFTKQSWPEKELLIAASGGDEGFIETARRLVPAHQLVVLPLVGSKTTDSFLGVKWQRMLEAATGDWVTLWGDDDWYHPERLAAILRRTPKSANAVVPVSLAIGLTLHNMKWWEHGSIYPGATMVRRLPCLAHAPFPRFRRLVDTAWYLDVKMHLDPVEVRLEDMTLSVCLYHTRNVTNRAILHDDDGENDYDGHFRGVPEHEARVLDGWIRKFRTLLYPEG